MPKERETPGGDAGEKTALEQTLLATLEGEIASNRLVLPSLPEVALRVRELMGQADCSVAQLARIIGSDAALAARLIKVVNSSSYRGHKTIDNIQAAITRLGLQLVRSLVTQLALLQSLHGSGAETRQLTLLSRHSMEVGAHCYAIAARYTKLNPEEALLAGLVHDIGKLPLLLRLRAPAAGPVDAAAAEALLQHLHGRIGAMVLRAWRFAPDMVAVADEHENLQRDPQAAVDYTDIVLLAHVLLHLRQGTQVQWTSQAAQAPAWRKLSLTPQQLLDDRELTLQIDAAQERLAG